MCSQDQLEAKRARDAAGELLTFPAVVDVETTDPETDAVSDWTVNLLLATKGVPPEVAGVFGEYGLMLQSIEREGDGCETVAIVA